MSTRIHHFFFSKGSNEDIAVKDSNTSLTYKSLNEQSIRYSLKMKEAGITAGSKVIVLLENSSESIAVICACSMLGAIYIAVSPSQSFSRLYEIKSKTDASAIIGRDSNRQLGTLCMSVVGRLVGSELSLQGKTKDLFSPVSTAYIVFTSGTTGTPKGIAMSHSAAIAFFQALVNHCGLSPQDNVGSISPLQFDFSYLDMGLAFGSGACLTIVPKTYFYQPARFINYLNKNLVTQMNSVPTLWKMLLRFAKSEISQLEIHSILYAGESFPLSDLRALKGILPSLKVTNCFGHSESIACSFYDLPTDLSKEQNVSFGRGYPGTYLRLVDSNGYTIENSYEEGELYVRCPSIFESYWKESELTRKVLCPASDDPNVLEFKSGDLSYRDSDGNFYFAGRCDEQVQINGNRVELNDIASTVKGFIEIRDAIAAYSSEKHGNCKLTLFVELEDGYQVSSSQIRSRCRGSLPDYMVPEDIFVVDQFELTENGKIDRKQLNSLIR